MGTEIAPPSAPAPTPTPEPEREPFDATPLLIGLLALALALFAAGAYFFLLRRNVKVFNLKGGKYELIGKAKVSKKNPVVDLTPFTTKAETGSFILVLDRLAAKALSGRTLTVNYGEKSLQHIVEDGGGEYQFEVDF
jgi:hypothetical protein